MKRHLFFILFFGTIIFVYLGKLILMKSAFLNGDYLFQFYPWSEIYSESIKNMNIPFWTKFFHSGFALTAEGQVGSFYPPNIVMFFMLPFKVAYNYSAVLHFVLAGALTYIYSRKMKAGELGAALSALLFCFGSAYAGCFYNTVMLKTLAWFPLGLFLLEGYFDSRRLRNMVWFGVVLGIQFLAGFAQMAFYSAIFYALYFIYGLIIRKQLEKSDIAKASIALFITLIISLPQLILSLQLAGVSARSDARLGFALWGSFLPLNLISTCFPYWIFHGARFYIGIFSLLFLFMAFYSLRKGRHIRPLFFILVFSIFLALGSYNPFYVLLLKLTKLYSLRNPSKLLFFGVFAASVLSGYGFSQFFRQDYKPARDRVIKIYLVFLSSMVSIFLFAKLGLYVFKSRIIDMGSWYVNNYIAGKEHHRYDIDTYLARVSAFYQQMIDCASFGNIFIIASLFLCITAIIICIYLLRVKKLVVLHKIFIIAIIFVDIYIFSFYGTGFRGNIKPFEYLKPPNKKILDIIKSDKELFRIMPLDLHDENMPFWAKPNANAIFGLDSVAAYTPLASQAYRERLKPLEIVDDSLGTLSPSSNALEEKYQYLRLLNVKYIITSRLLKYKFIENIASDNGIVLYKFKDYLPRVFFTDNLDRLSNSSACRINVMDYKNGYMRADISSDRDGFLIFSESYYPGWKVSIDGSEGDIIIVKDMVQAVKVSKGRHTIIFNFRPQFFK